jgi:hypothetical protein
MAGTDRNALPVEDLRHVVRMDALEVERDDPRAPFRRRAVQGDSGHVVQALQGVLEQLVLMPRDRVETGR